MDSSSNWSKNVPSKLPQWDGEAATLCAFESSLHPYMPHSNLAGTTRSLVLLHTTATTHRTTPPTAGLAAAPYIYSTLYTQYHIIYIPVLQDVVQEHDCGLQKEIKSKTTSKIGCGSKTSVSVVGMNCSGDRRLVQ